MRIFSKDNDKYSGRRSNRYESNDRVRSNRFGSDRGPVTMHDAVCDECGKECQVPFRPSGEKPIYCSSCFEKQGNGIPRRNSRDSRGSERDFKIKRCLVQYVMIVARIAKYHLDQVAVNLFTVVTVLKKGVTVMIENLQVEVTKLHQLTYLR